MDLRQAGLSQTGGTFDLAIQGDGFFLIETPQGQSLTRAGSFLPKPKGELVNPDGHRLSLGQLSYLPDAGPVAISTDGTLSAKGQPLAHIGLWQPEDPLKMTHGGGTIFISGRLSLLKRQQFFRALLKKASSEIARMIEGQRAYEMGQNFLEKEDERMRGVIETLGR